MSATFRNDEHGRVSFAVVAVIILIGSAAGAAYFQTVERETSQRPKVPGQRFNSAIDSFEKELEDMATSALMTGLGTYTDDVDASKVMDDTKGLLEEFQEVSEQEFDHLFLKRYNVSLRKNGILANIVMLPSKEFDRMVTPRYEKAQMVADNGTTERFLPVGFQFHQYFEMDLYDEASQISIDHVSLIDMNITTQIPAALQVLNSFDVSIMDPLVASMAQTLIFARMFGEGSDGMGIDIESIVKPNETMDVPGFETDGYQGLGFDSDIGPFNPMDLFHPEDRIIIMDLTFLILQIRTFGIWDRTFALKFVEEVRAYSIGEGGKDLDLEGLKDLIGRGSPNFINCEELVLDLFHLMKRIPDHINIVGPQAKKMLDLGFMAYMDDDWNDQFTHISSIMQSGMSGMMDGKGFLSIDWINGQLFLLKGYSELLQEFMALTTYYILRSYHFDDPSEVKEVALDMVDRVLEDGFLKYLPENIAIPPGSKDPYLEFHIKDSVRKASHKIIDLGRQYEVPYAGMSFNGYSMIYLFFAFFDRADVDLTSVMDGYIEVYENWTKKGQDFIDSKDIPSLNSSVEANELNFKANYTSISKDLNDLAAVDLSMNLTLNKTLNEAIATLTDIKDELSSAMVPMDPNGIFYIYGKDEETNPWRSLDSILGEISGNENTLNGISWDLTDLIGKGNASWPEHSEAVKAENILKAAITKVLIEESLIGSQLDLKWERDVLLECKGKLTQANATDQKSSLLYEVVRLLSEELAPHHSIGFGETIDELANDLGNASTEAKGLKLRGKNEKISMNAILKDERGVKGLEQLVSDNIRSVCKDYLQEIWTKTWVPLVDDNVTIHGHDTYLEATERKIFGSYLLSLASVKVEKATIDREITIYQDRTPMEIVNGSGSFKEYSEQGYLRLKGFVLDALISKLELLDDIFNTTEPYPSLAVTFDHVKAPGNGSTGNLFSDLSFDHVLGNRTLSYDGVRVFESAGTISMENMIYQFLNPFSKQWYDYYVSEFRSFGDGTLNIVAGIHDPDPSIEDGASTKLRTRIDYRQDTIWKCPSPLPAVKMRYVPIGTLFKRPKTLSLERNVFSNNVRDAVVNFTYEGYNETNVNETTFRVQILAQTKTMWSTDLVPFFSWLSDPADEAWNPVKELTPKIKVEDNGKKDLDPALGKVRLKVVLDIDRLKTHMFGIEFKDPEPILFIRVWRPTTFNALLSEMALRAITPETEMFQAAPSMEVWEQAFVDFEDENDPVIPVFDVGEGDKEVEVPLEIYLDDLFGRFLPPINIYMLDTDPDNDAYPRSDPRFAPVYDLTCRFDMISDIPSDSLVFFKRGMPFLIDFDGGDGWHDALRNMQLGYIVTMKNIPAEVQDYLFGILPIHLIEESFERIIPPSEYKFVRIYDFVPIYLQYFEGYSDPGDIHDAFEGKDVRITWGDDPDLFHLPYRAIPINVYRGRIASTLWDDLIKVLSKENYTLTTFYPDILGFIKEETEDMVGSIKDLASMGTTNGSKDLSGTLGALNGKGKYRKMLKDTYGLTADLPSVTFSTPGARPGFDLGANVYLGFDIGKGMEKEAARKWNYDTLRWMGILGTYYDLKTLIKVAKDIISVITSLEEWSKPKEKETQKKLDPVKQAQLTLKSYVGVYKVILKKFKEYKAMMEGKGLSTSDDYRPDLFRLQAEFELDNDTIKADGDLAWKLGFSIVDISILRHRNGFSVAEIKDLKRVYGFGQHGVHGLTCIGDLEPADVSSFKRSNDLYGFEPRTYCDYGNTDLAGWMTIREIYVNISNKKVIRDAASIGMSMKALWVNSNSFLQARTFIEKAKKVSKIPGHEMLFSELGDLNGSWATFEAAFDLRKEDGIFIYPFGDEGPSIYMYNRTVYSFSIDPSLPKGELETSIADMVQSVDEDAFGRTNIYYDANGSSLDVMDHIGKALSKAAAKLDGRSRIERHVVMSDLCKRKYIQRGHEVVEIDDFLYNTP